MSSGTRTAQSDPTGRAARAHASRADAHASAGHLISENVACRECGANLIGSRTTNQHVQGIALDAFTIATPAIVTCPHCHHDQLYMPRSTQRALPAPQLRRTTRRIPARVYGMMAATWAVTFVVAHLVMTWLLAQPWFY